MSLARKRQKSEVDLQGALYVGGVQVTATAAELNKLHGATATPAELSTLHGAPAGADFVVGAEAGGNTINVGIQLKDADGVALAVRGSVLAYLADDANGDVPTLAAPSGGVAIGTDGALLHLHPVAVPTSWQLISEADGHIDVDIVEAAGATWYLVLVLPNGLLVVSPAITFAA